MPRFANGQRVMFVDNPQLCGAVCFVHSEMGGLQFYDVQLDSGGLQAGVVEQDLDEAIVVHSAWDLLARNMLSSFQEFSVATTIHKVKNATNNTISSLHASRTLFKPYQYKPLVKLLQSDSKRIHIADEVGLGKTIEVGHIMLELRGRRRLRNALIVCPKSLQPNWQVELREKFSFEFKLYDSTNDLINDLQRDLNTQRSTYGIINYEKCRNHNLLDVLARSGYMFDLLVCDESHHLRNRPIQLYGAFEKIVQHAETIIFLSATPIMLSEEDLFNQIRLLEPERYPSYEVFQNAISLNRPFIHALHDLNKGKSLSEIADALHSASVRTTISIGEEYRFKEDNLVSELFGEDPLYQRARKRLLEGENTPENRARIQHDLSELNSLNHIYTRTRKREVTTDRLVVHRRPRRFQVSLSEEEQKLYDAVANRYEGLGVITHKRMIASSIVAYYTPQEALNAGSYRTDIPDSKYKAFEKILDEVVFQNGKKLLVFSTYKKTLRYLELKFRERGITAAVIHGDIENRAEEVDRFRRDPDVHVLLSSEVGREGLNLQFCDALVNYDLPWNPMRVEQRVGRIDRIGQKSEVVNIYSFTIRGTIEERIYERLLMRINVFRRALGDLEDILNEDEGSIAKQFDELERTLYTTKLSEAKQNELIDQVAQAVETERLNLETIEENLTDAIVSDVHFQNEIDRIVRNRRYLTDTELQQFVESLFRVEIQSHRLEKSDESCFQIIVPNNDRTVLFDFIERYMDSRNENPEMSVLYHRFKRRYYGERSIPVTFRQEHAYAVGDNVAFINSYHPLINAIANYFESRGYHANQAFRLGLKTEHLTGAFTLTVGDYLMVVYKLSVVKTSTTNITRQATLHAIIADLTDEDPKLLGEEISDHLLGLVQLYATSPSYEPSFDPKMVDNLRGPIARSIYIKQKEVETDEKLRVESSAMRRRMQQQQFFENQINRRRELLATGRGIERILVREIEQLELEMQQALEIADSVGVSCSNEIVSVSYLEIME